MITSTLYYIYDPMCAWCYAFAPTFEEVKKSLPKNTKIEYVPGGLAPHSNEPMPQEMRNKIETIWYQIEEVVGIKFNHDFWTKCAPRRSTYLSCQATLAAKKQNKEEEMIRAIQEAYYQRAMNPSDEETLFQLAKELNLDEKQFKKDIYDKSIIEEFEQMMNLRRRFRLNSFPSLAVKYKKEVYPINITYNEAKKIIAQIENITENVYF